MSEPLDLAAIEAALEPPYPGLCREKAVEWLPLLVAEVKRLEAAAEEADADPRNPRYRRARRKVAQWDAMVRRAEAAEAKATELEKYVASMLGSRASNVSFIGNGPSSRLLVTVPGRDASPTCARCGRDL